MDQGRTDTKEAAVECKIRVNEQVVAVVGERHSPAGVKQAAIEQDVLIKMDFVLSIVEGPGKTRIVEDEEVIVLVEDTCFIAVPDDDNS